MGDIECDVAVIGGGPGGSTVASFLRKYDPELRVCVFEKARFPREHVGESQLPSIGHVLNEIGAWDKVEAAGFPIKVGASYRWGTCDQIWDFEFLPLSEFRDQPRPARFEADRRLTAWQVDRAVYDKILLDHSRDLGAEVFEETKVDRIASESNTVTSLQISGPEGEREVRARWYVDASGHVGVLRRALDIGRTVPTSLKNMAVWDYWENTGWATTIGTGGTRVQVLSIGTGWIWFIPIGKTRTSIGFICPVEHYKRSGMSAEELYTDALSREPRVMELTKDATRDGDAKTTTDWSFVSDRLAGPNWFLVGEAAGFADPILAGGLALTHDSARAAAYVMLAINKDERDRKWLSEWYERSQSRRIRQFIRFADFWYAANGQFSDLQDITAEIADDAGLKLNPRDAFRWLSLGGFNTEDGGRPGLGGLDLAAVHEVTSRFIENTESHWELNKYNVFKLNLLGATKSKIPILENGSIRTVEAFTRGTAVLPNIGVNQVMIDVLKQSKGQADAIGNLIDTFSARIPWFNATDAMSTLETMLVDGWVKGSVDKRRPMRTYRPDKATLVTNFEKTA